MREVQEEKDENGSAEKDESEQVGYQRPTRRTRFKTGESGNPAGRPRGSKNPIAHLSKTLREPVVVSQNGRRKSITKCEALTRQLVHSGLRVITKRCGYCLLISYQDCKNMKLVVQQRQRRGILQCRLVVWICLPAP